MTDDKNLPGSSNSESDGIRDFRYSDPDPAKKRDPNLTKLQTLMQRYRYTHENEYFHN